MSILPAMQSAALRLFGRKPSEFFSSTATFEMEIANLVNEVARDICLSHDWQALIRAHTVTGDGATTSFPLPDDYDRMVLASEIADGQGWFWNYSKVPDLNTWVSIQTGNYLGVTPGWWILLGNELQFAPAPAPGSTAIMPYVSKNYAVGTDLSEKAEFGSDDDRFKLDDRLLTLGLIWRWREMKHLDVTGDQAAFEKAFAEASGRDKGARVIRGPIRNLQNVPSAYPWTLG